ncbi:MAG: type III pantothenate kinase [Phycisphaerales bacterium]
MVPNPPTCLLVSVGNTRTRAAGVIAGQMQPSTLLVNADEHGAAQPMLDGLARLAPASDSVIVLASVNEPVAKQVAEMFRGGAAGAAGRRRVVRLAVPGAGKGADELEVPIRTELTPPLTVGVDRLLNALAAHSRSGEACVVIDCGTAVTVDFVDQWGVFRGGCIAPGLGLSLWALHEQTAALPLVRSAEVKTLPAPPGKTTPDAMLAGCAAAIRGMVHHLVERYAELHGSYPRVIATGGDAPLILQDDDIVEHIVPDLTLMGLAAAWNGGSPDGRGAGPSAGRARSGP